MDYFNVHQTKPDNLQKLLNDHVTRGYKLHSLRGPFKGAALLAIFVKKFATVEERDTFIEAKEAARQAPPSEVVQPSVN